MQYNLVENHALRARLLHEAPLVKSYVTDPSWTPTKKWTGKYAEFEPMLQKIAKPYEASWGNGLANYEMLLKNDYLRFYPDGTAYATNTSTEFKFGKDSKYPGAIVLYDNQKQVVGYIEAVGNTPKYTAIEPEKEKTDSDSDFLDTVQLALDGVGFIIPGLGDVLDLVNATISIMRGNYVEAALSVIAAIPVVGSAIALPFKVALRSGGKLARVAAGKAISLFGKAFRSRNVIEQQKHMDEMWILIRDNKILTPEQMNLFAKGLGDVADNLSSVAAGAKNNKIVPNSAYRYLDELATWFSRNAKNSTEWIAKNTADAAKAVPALRATRAADKAADQLGAVSNLINKLPFGKKIRNLVSTKLNPSELSKLNAAMHLKFFKTLQNPEALSAMAFTTPGGAKKLYDAIEKAALPSLKQLQRANPTAYKRALAQLRNVNPDTALGVTDFAKWLNTMNPASYDKIVGSLGKEFANPSNPLYNRFMNSQWNTLKTYAFDPAYWKKAGSNMPDIFGMKRRFQDAIPLIYNEIQDMGEDVQAELGIAAPDDINGLFWPMLKSAAELTPWTRDLKKMTASGVRQTGEFFNIQPTDIDNFKGYDPAQEFEIVPDDDPKLKRHQAKGREKIQQTRRWM